MRKYRIEGRESEILDAVALCVLQARQGEGADWDSAAGLSDAVVALLRRRLHILGLRYPIDQRGQ